MEFNLLTKQRKRPKTRRAAQVDKKPLAPARLPKHVNFGARLAFFSLLRERPLFMS
jgi:hypothetical protein